jgi:hypothetical protein
MPDNTSYVPLSPEEARSVVGEGIHTSLRKGCENGSDAWRAIRDMPNEDWSGAIKFFVSGLDVMGLALCRAEDRARYGNERQVEEP